METSLSPPGPSPLDEPPTPSGVSISGQATVTARDIIGGDQYVKLGTFVSVYLNPAAELASPQPRAAEPYKFLDSYTFTDRTLFFGRESLASDCAAFILTHPTTLLTGEAAVGKTSLLHAGILPRFAQQTDIAAFSVRDYQSPAAGIHDALVQIPGLSLSLPDDNAIPALALAFAQQTGKRLVIFFDQFERLFALPLEAQDEFARQVVETKQAGRISPDAPIHLVFVLREKFRANASALDARIADLNLVTNIQSVPGLAYDGAARAITEPLHAGSQLDLAVVEPELVDRWILPQLALLSEAQDNRIEPAPLQIICESMFTAARSGAAKGTQPVMSVALYKKLGQAEGILQNYLTALKTRIGVNEADWTGMREVLGRLAGTDTLRFYSASELADATRHTDAGVKQWLSLLTQANLVQARADDGYALVGNYLVRTIREWFPEQYDQQTANAALARVISDWDDQQLLTEPRRLLRIRDARALLEPTPKAFVLLLRSAVAYEAQPAFWLKEIARDAPTHDALAQLQNGGGANPATSQVGQVLMAADTLGIFQTLGDATVHSPVENVRIASGLSLGTLGAETALAALQPYLSKGSLRTRWRALVVLAWMWFIGMPWTFSPLAISPLLPLVTAVLRIRANRIKIASVTASALTGTTFVGFIAAFTNLVLAWLAGFPLRNIPLETILLVAVGVTNGAIVGVCYGTAEVFTSRVRPSLTIALRILAIAFGFGLANMFVIGAQTTSFPDIRPFLVGALIGLGFAVGNELGLARAGSNNLARILLCAGGLALTAALATVATIWLSDTLNLKLITSQSLPFRFAGGINPAVFQPPWIEILYVGANAIMGAVMGVGLATGLVVGDWLAHQLDRARYV